jgi:hypothetical protein
MQSAASAQPFRESSGRTPRHESTRGRGRIAGDCERRARRRRIQIYNAQIPRQRVKAAGVAARYTHAHAGGAEAPTMIVLEDKFGFKVDPELARAERDDSVRESSLGVPKKGSAEAGAIEKELEEIRKRRAERLALVKFPDGYTYGDREDDQKRLQQLYSKRCSRKKLTPEEEAEEAHLAVRVLNPVKVKDVFALKGPKGRIYELEKRRVGEILTPAEEDELQDL